MIKINKPVDGIATGKMYRVNQDGRPVAVTYVTLRGSPVSFSIGNLHWPAQRRRSVHPWHLGPSLLRLVLQPGSRYAETAWAIPPPPAGRRQMPSDAKPDFDVATIKPNNPAVHPNLILDYKGRHLTLYEFSVNDLIPFAYDLHIHQVTGTPSWLDTER